MTKYEYEIEMEAPIDYAFEWGCEARNWQRSMPGLTAVELLEETENGGRYRTTFKMLGRSTTGESLFEIVELKAHTVSHLTGDMSGTLNYYFTETETGTELRFVAEFEDAKSLFERALQPVFKRYMGRQFRNHVQTIKGLVEAEYAAEIERVVP